MECCFRLRGLEKSKMKALFVNSEIQDRYRWR